MLIIDNYFLLEHLSILGTYNLYHIGIFLQAPEVFGDNCRSLYTTNLETGQVRQGGADRVIFVV